MSNRLFHNDHSNPRGFVHAADLGRICYLKKDGQTVSMHSLKRRPIVGIVVGFYTGEKETLVVVATHGNY